MKIENLCTYFLALAVLALTTGGAVAQQPFQGPGPDERDQDEPIVVRPNQDRVPPRPFSVPGDEDETPDQTVLLNTEYAGWQEASAAGARKRITNKLRANWVMVDDNGRFEGHVTAGQGADITRMSVYLLNMGRMVKETMLEADGSFHFNNVRQGSYALIGWGNKGFFAYGLNILAYSRESEANMPPNLEVIAFQNETTINTDWIRYFAPGTDFRVYGRYPQGEGFDDAAALYGLEGLVRNAPQASPATSISSHPVKLTGDGRMVGRVHQLTSITGRPVDVRSTKVMLLQGDGVVASTETDNYGVFQFTGVADGHYGLLAAGVDGMGLVGINVGTGPEEDTMNALGELIEDSAGDDGEVFDFCLVSSETVGWLNHTATELDYRRNLLAKRRPNQDQQRACPNCDGMGCSSCKGTGLCTSRSQSFEDWANSCCNQHEKTKLGSGYILSEGSKDLRRIMKRSNDTFEKAFYGNSLDGEGFQENNYGGTDYNDGTGYGNGNYNGTGNGNYDGANYDGANYNGANYNGNPAAGY